jgi:hypothetical protein
MDWATVLIGLGDYMAFSLTGNAEKYFDRFIGRSRGEVCSDPAAIFRIEA